MMGQPANEAFFCYYGQPKKLFSDSITCTLMMSSHVIAAAGIEIKFFVYFLFISFTCYLPCLELKRGSNTSKFTHHHSAPDK